MLNARFSSAIICDANDEAPPSQRYSGQANERMTKEGQNEKSSAWSVRHFNCSSFFRDSSFGFRHSKLGNSGCAQMNDR